MKKNIIMAMIAVIVSMSMSASNMFFMSWNDTIRIHPNRLDGYSQQVISMMTEAYCDAWTVSMRYPKGMSVKLVSGIAPESGMCVPYYNAAGEARVYEPQLQVSAAYADVSASTSSIYGFYDYAGNGTYVPYGTVKWEPGSHEMFTLNFYVAPDFRSGELTMDAVFSSSADSRGAVLANVRAFKTTYIYVGYMRGDVNGDGRINITDATILIQALQEAGETIDYLDEFSLAASDLNRDGEVNVTDVTILINILNND